MSHDNRHPLVGANPTPPPGGEVQPSPVTGGRDAVCRRLLVALREGGDEYGRGVIGVRHLAGAAGTTSRTVRTHLPHLVERRLLVAEMPQPGVNPPLVYWVFPPLPPVVGGDR